MYTHFRATRGGVGASKASRKGPPASIESQSRTRKSVYGAGASRTILSSSSRAKVQLGGSDKLGAQSKAPVTVSR